jgi:hypothetical protein
LAYRQAKCKPIKWHQVALLCFFSYYYKRVTFLCGDKKVTHLFLITSSRHHRGKVVATVQPSHTGQVAQGLGKTEDWPFGKPTEDRSGGIRWQAAASSIITISV